MRTVDKVYLDEKEDEEDVEEEEEVIADGIKYKVITEYKFPNVLKWMTNSIIILMVAILITSILHTMSLHIINSNFNWFNIFDADLKFKPKPLAEVSHILEKMDSPSFDITQLKQSETKFVYEDDENLNLDDLRFLIEMEVDKTKTVWKAENIGTYLFQYPEMSEGICIVWLIMTIIYQCSEKESNWSIPQGWRIVVPSIFVFFIMSIISSIMAVTGNKWLNNFCFQLKKEFKEPDLIRCGLAISHFRLQRQSHEFIFDTFLNIYRHMNYAKAFCWTLAFIVILLRFLFAIDFQLIELKMVQYDKPALKPQMFSNNSFSRLSTHIDLSTNATSYESDNPSEFIIKDEKHVRMSDKDHTYNSNPNTDDKKKIINSNKTKNYEEDDDIEDFQSASSIMMRTPLMDSGDYIHSSKK